jgi:hypothetical protein
LDRRGAGLSAFAVGTEEDAMAKFMAIYTGSPDARPPTD